MMYIPAARSIGIRARSHLTRNEPCMILPVKILIGVLTAVTGVTATGVVVSAATDPGEPTPSAVSHPSGVPADAFLGEVSRVVDGDTVDAVIEGDTKRVRLLVVDAPETKHPNEPVQCLGPESSTWLTERIGGNEVWLAYDEDHTDRYDRELLYVWDADGAFVNRELVAEGLATAVYYEPNDRYLAEVQAAEAEATAAKRGLWSEQIECTEPAKQARAAADKAAADKAAADQAAAEAKAAADAQAAAAAAAAQAQADEQARAAAAAAARPGPARPAPAPPAPAPAPPAPAPAAGCHPSYSPCIPTDRDYDCGELSGPYAVTGPDEYRLDRDSDGVGCE